MIHHINTIRKAGINPVVCVNSFHTDTKEEIEMVKKAAEAAGARCAKSTHWAQGGEGAVELADAVIDACNEKNDFKFLYPLDMKLRDRVALIAKEVYGADGVSWTSDAETKAKNLENDPQYNDFATMMVKTHLSLSMTRPSKAFQGLDTADSRCADLFWSKVSVPCAGTSA